MITNKIHISDTFGGRLDPHQFHYERMEVINRIYSTKEWTKLKFVVRSVKTVTKEFSEDDIYIGLENIVSNTGDYFPTSDKESISSAAIFLKGDILFPKLRPYLNKVFRADFGGKCSTEFHVFEAKDINPDYLTIILRSSLIVNQTKHLMTGNTLPRLQTSDIEDLVIPLPSIEVQQRIVDIYHKASSEKQAKEQEAQKLLDSIDGYLLGELGITLPETPARQLSFKVSISEMLGTRNDPEYYNYRNQQLLNCIHASPHKLSTLQDVTQVLSSGRTPAASDYSDDITLFPIIKAGSYTNDSIDLMKVDYCVKEQNLIVKKGDIFVLSAAHQANYVGKQIKILEEAPIINTSYVGELICLRTNGKYNPIVLFSLLNTQLYKQLLNREKRGQTSHIYTKDIAKIPIPIVDNQTEIAETISALRIKASALQASATAQLDTAKQQIEKIILG